MIKIGLIGAKGRMGLEIIKLINNNPHLYSVTHIVVSNPDKFNKDLVNSPQIIIDNSLNCINNANLPDVIIDFSSPVATLANLPYCLKHNLPILIGTTGFSSEEQQQILSYKDQIPILIAPNTCLSICLLFRLTEIAAIKLADFDSEILELHHRDKKDSPSGTALKIGEVIAKARNLDFDQHAIFSRHGHNSIRNKDDIGFSVLRGGSAVGMHEVFFMGLGETLSLKGEITNRASYANGALNGASFLVNQKPGLYDMNDVLEL